MTINRILVINGSYRDGGITDQAIECALDSLADANIKHETIQLRDYPIEFCLNCRECTQTPGETPGRCVLNDNFAALIDRIESADAYILAAPTNFGSVTALFKRFMERLTVYAYWPWDVPYPKPRKSGPAAKKALLISSCAAPGLLGRWLYGSSRQLKMTAKTIGAKSVGILFSGLISQDKSQRLPADANSRLRTLTRRLIAD